MDPGLALALKQVSSKTALRSLAFKWIRIVYDEKAYLQALTRRGSTEDQNQKIAAFGSSYVDHL